MSVVDTLVAVKDEWIYQTKGPTFSERVNGNPKYFPFSCVRDAGNGAHIPAIISSDVRSRFRNRKGMFQ